MAMMARKIRVNLIFCNSGFKYIEIWCWRGWMRNFLGVGRVPGRLALVSERRSLLLSESSGFCNSGNLRLYRKVPPKAPVFFCSNTTRHFSVTFCVAAEKHRGKM
jgi:hypothetical protein